MKTLQVAAFVSILLGSMAAHAGEPSVSVTIRGEVVPGVYGEVQVGNAPPPPVVYAQPVIIVPPAHHDHDEGPIYLHVPPGHARNWAHHCHEYNACNRQVYFVKSAEYEPGYRAHGKHGEARRDERRDEFRDEGRRDEGRGRGHGRGNEDRRGEGRD